MTRIRFAGLCSILVAACIGASSAWAQGTYPTYPERPVRLIVGFAAGSSNDTSSRLLARRLSERLKQTIVVENIAGAGSAIGAQAVANATPDGYTLGVAANAIAIQAALQPSAKFDPLRDLAPVALVGESTPILIVNPQVPAKSVAELVAYAKSRPALAYGSAGIGSGLHIYGELFKQLAGLELTHVPYKGEAQALVDVISGQVPMMFGTLVGSAGAVRGGKVRALAVTTRTRTPEMPELPTMIESGFPTYAMSGWFGIVAPKAVPRPIVERVARDINAILAEPEVVGEYAKAGIVVRRTASPDEFASFFSSQIEQFKSIIAKSGMKVETN